MVAVMEEMDGEERPVHQGCMAGFLHLFDRPQMLSGRRLHHTPRRLLSSSSGSATPSERSMQLGDRSTPLPSSPDATPPAAPRPSLQLPPLDLAPGSVGAAPSWRLPRLSLDSRAVVDGRGKYRPREIRTSTPASATGVAPPSPGLDERRSPSVVARLMGLDALPHQDGETAPAQACGGGGELRRSASERVPRGADPSRFRFVDPAFFERPASPQPREQQQQYNRPSTPPVPAVAQTASSTAAYPRGGVGNGVQRRNRFDAREVFPEPAKPANAAGEIALYGEIERRLRKRGIAEPARDLETLKQVLEALQLKGLLRHHTAAPSSHPAPPAGPVRTPPPIVVMRPAHRASSPTPQQQQPSPPPVRRLRVDVDRPARRLRSPDLSPARSPASPARRSAPQSPQRRGGSPAQSPKQQQPPAFRKSSTFDAAAARSRIARRAAQNSGLMLFPDEEAASTTFSDGGSSGGSYGASSRWDFDPPLVVHGDETSRKLERCGKLLTTIHALTGGDTTAPDQQPSPVSVLDAAAFLADEDSPSSSSGGSKRVIDFNIIRSPRQTNPPAAASAVSDDLEEDDEWALTTTEGVDDPDYAYVAELVRLFVTRTKDVRHAADAYKLAEQSRRLSDADTCCHRRLLCGAVAEALDRHRGLCPWDPLSRLRGAELVSHVWSEVRRARQPAPLAPGEVAEDLNDVTCSAIRRDLLAADDGPWAASATKRRVPGQEVADALLQIERLVFKDLVADTIRELAEADCLVPPRRRLVF